MSSSNRTFMELKLVRVELGDVHVPSRSNRTFMELK